MFEINFHLANASVSDGGKESFVVHYFSRNDECSSFECCRETLRDSAIGTLCISRKHAA